MRSLVLAPVLLLVIPALGQRRNVVLVVTDDQGDVAGCYGHPDARTPHLDALAAEGARFANAFCTTASCSPSRAVLLSGQHGHTNGMYGLQHRTHHFQSFDRVRSLPAILAERGWRTARVGKYHVAPEQAYPFQRALPGSARNPVRMAESCATFLEEIGDEPFFLYFCTSDPHRGGGAADDLPGRPDRFGNRDYPGVERARFDPQALDVPSWLPEGLETRAELAQFLESIQRADQGLGRLVEVLRAAGAWDETLVVFLSDHGPPFPGAKTTVYEPGLRIACVARDPFAEQRGIVVDALVSIVDVVPTVLEFCGVPAPEGLHGRSWLPWTAGESPRGWVDEIFASHTFHEVTMYYPMRVVRTSRYKLIWNVAHPLPFPFASDLWGSATWQATLARGPDARYGLRTVSDYVQRPRFELYDLQRDPDEVANLADDPAQEEILADLQARLRAFQERTDDPWLLKWERE